MTYSNVKYSKYLIKLNYWKKNLSDYPIIMF